MSEDGSLNNRLVAGLIVALFTINIGVAVASWRGTQSEMAEVKEILLGSNQSPGVVTRLALIEQRLGLNSTRAAETATQRDVTREDEQRSVMAALEDLRRDIAELRKVVGGK